VSDRNLTVARLVTDHIDGITVEGDAFGDLLSELGIAPKVERRATVTSEKPGDNDTRTYIVSVHVVPGTDGTTRVYACTCGAFKFHELLSNVEEIRDDPEAGFESVGRCKHGDAVAVEDRTAEDREAGQQGFGAFSGTEEGDP
jgi:hypothetical protein